LILEIKISKSVQFPTLWAGFDGSIYELLYSQIRKPGNNLLSNSRLSVPARCNLYTNFFKKYFAALAGQDAPGQVIRYPVTVPFPKVSPDLQTNYPVWPFSAVHSP
jgi:hypothetical protein